MPFTDLKPYFHGVARRSGAPFCFGTGLPYMPVTMKASSLVASAMVRPSTYGQGYQDCEKPGATSGLLKVSKRMNFALESGAARSTRFFSGKPLHGTAIDQASTQRWR